MTQIRTEQQEQLEATAGRAATKIRAFIDGLPVDEQMAVNAILLQARAQPPGSDDATGYVSPVAGIFIGFLAGKVLDEVWKLGGGFDPSKGTVGQQAADWADGYLR